MRIDRGKLYMIMAEKELTQIDIALKCRISAGRLSNIIYADSVKPKTVGKIAKALNVKIEEIIERIEK